MCSRKPIGFIVFAITFVLGVFLLGQSFRETKSQHRNYENYFDPSMKGGVALGLLSSDGILESEQNFSIDSSTLKKSILIGNMFEEKREYKLLLFIDYQQASFWVDSIEYASYDLKIGENATQEIPFEIRNLPDGQHDIIFVVVKFPNEHTLEEEFRKYTDSENLLFVRFNVTVGKSNDFPKYEKTNIELQQETILDGVFLSEESDVLRRWLTKETTDENVDCFIHVGNQTNQENQSIVVIVLLDWKQIEFYEDNDVIFTEVPFANQICIPATIHLQKTDLVQELTVISIRNPSQQRSRGNSTIDTCIRVGITYKQ